MTRFESFMRNVKFGRSLVTIGLSSLVVFLTWLATDHVDWKGKMKVQKLKYDSGVELVLVKVDGSDKKERSVSASDMMEAYITYGVKEFECQTYSERNTPSCEVPKQEKKK